MRRLLAVGLIVSVALMAGLGRAATHLDDDLKVEGTLTADDPKDKKTKTASKVHDFKMKAGSAYIIRMTSDEVDAYLRLENADGKQLAENDDEGPGTFNSRIVFKCDKDGAYKIICTCYGKPEGNLKTTGKYTLTVKTASEDELKKIVAEERKKAFPHEHMIGKAAPDLSGEFCLNGKTKKLSDLKGKVVMVDFWAVWCGPCIATFPHLREWSKEYEKDGLVILGATTYYDRYGFDKENGKLVKADPMLKPAEEQAMVKDFAEHHKLTHQLLILSKDSWKQAGSDYNISGIPTAAVIDRQGIVQLVVVGSGEPNAKKLEGKIKELLAQK
jgi:thiol-disulfide isomerase/thioredoxin